MNRIIFCFMVVILLAAGGRTVAAHSYELNGIAIGHVWAPPSDNDGISAYGPVFNKGPQPDKITAIESPVAEKVLFQKKGDDGKLASSETLDLPPGKPVSLASWGTHIQLEGVKKTFKEGDNFPLTITFEKAGKITIDVDVEAEPSDHDED